MKQEKYDTLSEIYFHGGLRISMTKYPNREALRKAHDIYLDAMRPFIIRCLKKLPGQTLEDLISDVLDYEPNDSIETVIDIGNIPRLLKNYWYDVFGKEFNADLNVQNTTWLITEGRNFWAHPGMEDVDAESTRTHLFHVARVLSEIKNRGAKQAVEAIRDQLFSDEVEEHPAEVENADLKERLAEMSKQLAAVEAEKNEFEKRFQDVQKRLADIEEVEEEWLASEERLKTVSKELTATKAVKIELEQRLETKSIRLEEVKAELVTCEEDLTCRLKQLEEVKAEKHELEERLAKVDDSFIFQGAMFTKKGSMWYAASDSISQVFWNYWHEQGREGKEDMRDAGWRVEKVDGDWEITISPEDFEAWISEDGEPLTLPDGDWEMISPEDFDIFDEPPIPPTRTSDERTTLPTGKEMERPALELLADGREHRRLEIINGLTEHFSLTKNQREQLSRSGRIELYLRNKDLIERTRTGYYRITDLGLEVLKRGSH